MVLRSTAFQSLVPGSTVIVYGYPVGVTAAGAIVCKTRVGGARH